MFLMNLCIIKWLLLHNILVSCWSKAEKNSLLLIIDNPLCMKQNRTTRERNLAALVRHFAILVNNLVAFDVLGGTVCTMES